MPDTNLHRYESPWSASELLEMREDAVKTLILRGELDEDRPELFTCDTCNDNNECEWVYFTHNISPACLAEVVYSQGREQ